MKRTEKPSKPAGAGIWNRILAAMLIFILVLALVLGFLILRQGGIWIWEAPTYLSSAGIPGQRFPSGKQSHSRKASACPRKMY